MVEVDGFEADPARSAIQAACRLGSLEMSTRLRMSSGRD